ncbi:MAG TPA: hypothetical protein VGK36_13035 [Candidatus Angelobacter sp.]
MRGNPDYLSRHAGQHLLQMIVNLLARQYEVIMQIILEIPEIPTLPNIFPEPFIVSDQLRSQILGFAKAISGGEIAISASTDTAITPDCIVYIGAFDPSKSAVFCISAVADGWRFDCATHRPTQETEGTDSNPFGPYIAACYAAGTIFKYFWQLDAKIDLCASLWNCVEAQWDDLAVGKSPLQLTLPTTYLIGCGAVGAAFAFTLATIEGVKGEIVAIDPQPSDETSRNRLLTISYADLENKATLIERLFVGKALSVYPYVGLWPNYTTDANRKTPERIRKIEKDFRYEWVISCVDRNIHRRDIAVYLPRFVFGGSTHDFVAQVAVYSMQGECECLGCNHPVPMIPATEELRISLLAMNSQELNNWFDKHDVNARERAAIGEYLHDPGCGGVGQELVAKLGRGGETDWSVGFVSVAAGVLLAAVFLQALFQEPQAMIRMGPEYFAWFLRSGLGTSHALRKSICEICGSDIMQDNYQGLWGMQPKDK